MAEEEQERYWLWEPISDTSWWTFSFKHIKQEGFEQLMNPQLLTDFWASSNVFSIAEIWLSLSL